MSFNSFPKKPWLLRVCSTSLQKTLWNFHLSYWGPAKKKQEKNTGKKKPTQNCLGKKNTGKKTQPFLYTYKKGCFFVFEQ